MKRPLSVSLIGLLLVFVGVLQVVVGAMVLVRHDRLDFLNYADISAEGAKAIGIIFIVVGVVAVLLAAGLLRGSRFVRWVIGLHQAIQLGVAIDSAIQLDEQRRIPSLVTAASAALVLWLLFGTRRAREFFAKS